MKKLILSLLSLLLAAAMLGIAPAESGYSGATYFDEYYEHATPDSAGWVHVSGRADIRSRPDADAPVMERAYDGSDYEYMNQTQVDSRGNTWYCVYCYGYLGWISSDSGTLQWSTFY